MSSVTRNWLDSLKKAYGQPIHKDMESRLEHVIQLGAAIDNENPFQHEDDALPAFLPALDTFLQ